MSTGDSGFDSTEISFVEDTAKKTRRDWLILVSVCLVIAAVLRLLRIDYREFTGNEFLTLNLLAGGGPEIFLGRAWEGSTSIYHSLMRAWVGMFGTDSETLVRLPSAIFGLATCVIFFLFSHKYLRGTALAICMLIFAMNPTLVATSIDASPYALLTFFVTVAHYFAIRSLDKGGVANWTIYGLSVLGGIFTHPVYLCVLPAHFLFALLRSRRTPKTFVGVSVAGLVALVGLAVWAGVYAKQNFPDVISVQTPSSSDLAKGLVSVSLGNIVRFDAQDPNDFVRGVMYLFVFLTIILSVQYYRKRTAEAAAMPHHVVWIDETQDVVGTWERLSLRAFLLFQWFGFVIPLVVLFALAGVVPGLRMSPELLVIILPSLAVLMAMGIDAAPKEGALALGLLLLLVMVHYDVRVLKDTGYGVRDALETVRDEKFDPNRDLLIYSKPNSSLTKAINIYKGKLPATPVPGFSNRKDYADRLQQMTELTTGYDRVFVIYHNDRGSLGKTEGVSPIRDWFRESDANHFTEIKDWKKLSEVEATELRVYKRLAPGEQPEG